MDDQVRKINEIWKKHMTEWQRSAVVGGLIFIGGCLVFSFALLYLISRGLP